MTVLRLEKEEILAYQKNRPPFLMIDVVEEVIPGVSSKGYKNLSPDDWYFACHFPGDPNLPGMLQLEAIVQMSAMGLFTLPDLKGKVAYVTTASQIKWMRKVIPSDTRYDIDTQIISFKRGLAQCRGEGRVNGELACQAEFSLGLPDILNMYKIKV